MDYLRRTVIVFVLTGLVFGVSPILFSEDILVPEDTLDFRIEGYKHVNIFWAQANSEIDIVGVESPGRNSLITCEVFAQEIRIDTNSNLSIRNMGNSYQATPGQSPYGLGGAGASHGGQGGRPIEDLARRIIGVSDGFTIEDGAWGGRAGDTRIQKGGEESRYGGAYGGPGAGSLVLRANTISIDGVIDANGSDGENGWIVDPRAYYPDGLTGGGGGSGGGILIIAKNLTIGPNARIYANGGNGGKAESAPSGYGGGGGRIKIYYETGTVSPEAVIEARAGKRGNSLNDLEDGGAEDGTVVIRQLENTSDLLQARSDLNEDGRVNYEDLFIMQREWESVIFPMEEFQKTFK